MRFNHLTLKLILAGTVLGQVGSTAHAAKHDYRARATNAIVGHCTLQNSISNPLAQACDHLVLVLRTPDGVEAARTETDSRGNFKLAAILGTKYKLTSGSKDFEVTSPTREVTGGDILDIKVEAH